MTGSENEPARPRLMVVEDDEGLQRQLKWALEQYDVVIAGDRQAALDAVRAHEPDVVTLDLGLPPDPDGTSEGFAILERRPELVSDIAGLAELWRHGSVVRSWLLDITAAALAENPTLDGIAPWVPDSGEGRWTVAEAIELDVPAPVITQSLIERLRSRQDNAYADRMLAAMRAGFGGHGVKPR